MDALEQPDEGRCSVGRPRGRGKLVRAPVAGDDLAEERDLADAPGGQAAAFRNDLVHRPRALVAPGLGHDAEGTGHVAPLLDGDKGRHGPFVGLEVVADRVLRILLLGDVDDRLTHGRPRGARRAEIVQIAGHAVEFLRAHDEVHVGEAVEQAGSAVLRHASENSEDEVGIPAPALLRLAGLADGLLLRGVAHAAGIQQEHVAIVLGAHDPVAAGAQHRRHGLAVPLVHLAAVGFYEDAVHGPERLHRRPGRRVNALSPGEHIRGRLRSCLANRPWMGRAAPGEPGWTIGSPGGPALRDYLRRRLTLSWATAKRTKLSRRSISAGGRAALFLSSVSARFLASSTAFSSIFSSSMALWARTETLSFEISANPSPTTSSSVRPPLVTRSSPSETWVRSDMWPGRTPISPSTVGITTPSIVSEYTRASGVTISRFRGMGSAHFFVVAMTSSIPPFM